MNMLAVPLLHEAHHDDGNSPTAGFLPSPGLSGLSSSNLPSPMLPPGGRLSATALAPRAMYGSGMRRLVSEGYNGGEMTRQNSNPSMAVGCFSRQVSPRAPSDEVPSPGDPEMPKGVTFVTENSAFISESSGFPRKVTQEDPVAGAPAPAGAPPVRRSFRRSSSRMLPPSNIHLKHSSSDIELKAGGQDSRFSIKISDQQLTKFGRSCVFRCWEKWTKWIIDPSKSKRLEAWDVIVLITLCTVALLVPYECAFWDTSDSTVSHIFCIIFAIDTALQFFIAYPDPNHPTCFVRSPVGIVRKYLRFWFWVDIVSIIPVDVWAWILGITEKDMGGWRMVRLVRLLRLLRLTHLKRLLRRWNTSIGLSNAGISLCKFLGFTVLWCHWTACVYGCLARQPEPKVTWLTGVERSKLVADGAYSGEMDVYFIALYWAIATFTSIGYGDVTPQTTTEYIVCSISMAGSAAAWAFIIGKVCTLMSTMTASDHKFRQNMDNLNWFMKEKKVPEDLRGELRRYLFESVHMRRLEEQSAVLDHLSPMLQGEIAMHLHKPWIDKVWYLCGLERDVVVVLARRLYMMVFAPREEVYNERTLFIVRRGLCIRKGRMLFNGDVWGEDMILSNPCLREQVRVLSVGYLEVVMLQYVDLDDALKDFPQDRQRLRQAQIKIALRHGIVKIARVLKDLEFHRGEPLELTEQQWNCFFKQVLEGTFTGEIAPPEEEEDLVEQEIEHIIEAAEEELAEARLGVSSMGRHNSIHLRSRSSAASARTSLNSFESTSDEEEIETEGGSPTSKRSQAGSKEEGNVQASKSEKHHHGDTSSRAGTMLVTDMSLELSALRDAICDLQLKVDCLLLRDHPRHHGHHQTNHNGSHHHHAPGTNSHEHNRSYRESSHHDSHHHHHQNHSPDHKHHHVSFGTGTGSERPPALRSFMHRRVQSVPGLPGQQGMDGPNGCDSRSPFAAGVQLERSSFNKAASISKLQDGDD